MVEALEVEKQQAEKKGVALNSIFAAIAITLLKVVVGITTGSLGILSEAAHSGLDLVAAAITYFSVRVSDRPADAIHQYGHGKVENFSAFIETALLLATCVWIVYEAAKRLFFHSVEIEPSVWAFVVYVSWRLARETIDALLDAAPAGIRSRIIANVSSVNGVLAVDRVRIRRGGNKYFADI